MSSSNTTSIAACVSDPNLPGCNSCRNSSAYPGCSDPFCTARLCDALNQTQCCDTAWSEECALAASRLCIPEVIPIYDEPECPLGFICHEDMTYKSSCTEIRQIPKTYLLGDLFAGVYCPRGSNNMINCPLGRYCPEPDQKLVCPEGKYCPYKSAEPWLDCPTCEEGAQALERDFTGLLVLATLVPIIIMILIVSYLREKYKNSIAESFKFLSIRRWNPNQMKETEKKKKKQLARLKPKLAVIAERLGSMENSTKTNESSEAYRNPIQLSSSQGEEDGLDFDARAVFDALDKNGDGVLHYSELNVVLGFEEKELEMFVASMWKVSKANDTLAARTSSQRSVASVSRPVFVNNFLKALEGVANLQVSADEAANTYDTILAENGSPLLYASMLYSSSLSRFLSDIEIMLLIKKFRSLPSIDEESQEPRFDLRRRTSMLLPLEYRRKSGFVPRDHSITREEFIKHYPTFLLQVHSEESDNSSNLLEGIDICFQNLSLQVTVAKKEINVVNEVTGRICAKTMTALMGGSGAGKTSLLNALCGRAHYGTILGDIHINGKKMAIDEIKSLTGFVPQDDVVYAELTVRENLMYAGKLTLPRNTSLEEIEDLADTTLANLGLVRVADSLVGDVKRRGVSGGEKKRVNIGLELMARPGCLFLDEPTSGLDSSSALLVMSSLKNLVASEGVTVVTVIHQPRKFIFDLIDSLILLGVGGNTVYSGPCAEAYDYFHSRDYVLPEGEALADWLIDISCGQIHPEHPVAATKALEPSEEVDDDSKNDEVVPLTSTTKRMASSQVMEAMGSTGFAVGKVNEAIEDASFRREWLYQEWNHYFKSLPNEKRKSYDIPQETELPEIPIKPSFLSQLSHQLGRALLVSNRNFISKLFDSVILILAAIIISLVSGLPEMTRNSNPNIQFETIVTPTEDNLRGMVVELFKYAATMQLTFPLQIGLITAVLIGLQASKVLTSKRTEFFRETSSGYDPNAYFLAVNIVSTLEAVIQIAMVAFAAAFLREPVASWMVFFVHFIVLAWICVSWALFFPMIVPEENVTTVIGFFMAFFALLLSGAVPPVDFDEIYGGGIVEHLAAWFSVTRFFVEGLAVSEHRCLPDQSGWTVSDYSFNFDRDNTLMFYNRFGYASHDPNATRVSCNGFYWGVLPSVFVGITIRYAAFLAMHTFNRAKQTKKPLLYEIKKNRRVGIIIAILVLIMAVLIGVTSWLYTRDINPEYIFVGVNNWIEQANNTLGFDAGDLGLDLDYIPNLFELNSQLDADTLAKVPQPDGTVPPS